MILTLALALAPAAPQGPLLVAAPAALAQEAPVRRKATRLVIRLNGGGVVRGLARPADQGGFELKRDRGWMHLPAAVVTSARPEKELLAEHAARLEDASLSPADLVAWLLDEGLLEEAFALGDTLVEEHPDDLDLRGVCAASVSHVGGLPERGAEGEFGGLRKVGARAGAMMREALVERVMTAAPRAELLEGFLADLKTRDPGRRAFAVFCMGRLFPKDDPRAVLLHAVYDPDPRVRAAAGRAVGDMGAREVGRPLVDGLGSETPEVRVRCAEALGNARAPEFVEPLLDRLYMLSAPAAAGSGGGGRPPHAYIFVGTQSSYIQDFDVEVAQFSSVADPVVNVLTTGSVLDAGVINTSEVTILSEARVVRQALVRIVGHDAGRRAKDWQEWWESEAAAPYRGQRGAAPGAAASPGR